MGEQEVIHHQFVQPGFGNNDAVQRHVDIAVQQFMQPGFEPALAFEADDPIGQWPDQGLPLH